MSKRPCVTADEFIAAKEEEFEWDREHKISVSMKDIGRKGRHLFLREAWTFHKQSNIADKVLFIERLKKVGTEGEVIHKQSQKVGSIEYRFGYFLVAKTGNHHGTWMFGQYCPVLPARDFKQILRKAIRDGTIKGDL